MTKPRNPAQLETKNASLSSDFGLEWATKLFGAEAIESLPKLTRGPNKGKPKGYVIWRKAIKGGWAREVQGVVAHGGLADAWIGSGPFVARSDAMVGQWLGRQQSLGGPAHLMFEEGRARAAAQQASEEARAAQDRVAHMGDYLVRTDAARRAANIAEMTPEELAEIRAYVAKYHPDFKEVI